MLSRSVLALVFASFFGLVFAQSVEVADSPAQILIKLDLVEHSDGMQLPTATVTHDKIKIYRGKEKAAFLKLRSTDDWGKSLTAPRVRTFVGFPALIAATNGDKGYAFRTVVFADGESLLLSFGYYFGGTDYKDLKLSDFELHTTYIQEGDIVVVRRDDSTIVIVEVVPVTDGFSGLSGVD